MFKTLYPSDSLIITLPCDVNNVIFSFITQVSRFIRLASGPSHMTSQWPLQAQIR